MYDIFISNFMGESNIDRSRQSSHPEIFVQYNHNDKRFLLSPKVVARQSGTVPALWVE
jgi:hypothetical protein